MIFKTFSENSACCLPTTNQIVNQKHHLFQPQNNEIMEQSDKIFFDDENDKQTSIETIVSIVIYYKKAQSKGKIPKTRWSNIAETKKILDEEMPIEDKYFEDERIIQKDGSKLTIDEIRKDFESFIGRSVKPQDLGYILKKNGFRKSSSNGITYYKGWSFNTQKNQTLEVHN